MPLLPWLGPDSAAHDLAQVTGPAAWVASLLLLGISFALLYWHPATIEASVRIVAFGMLGLMFCAHLVYRPFGLRFSDMQAFADRLAVAEAQDAPIAHWREYHGDFHFLGRLEKPLALIDTRQALLDWMGSHRQGLCGAGAPARPDA